MGLVNNGFNYDGQQGYYSNFAEPNNFGRPPQQPLVRTEAQVADASSQVDTTEQSWFQSLAQGTDQLYSGSRKSGRFNSLFDKPLYYPIDLIGDAEMNNWLEFKVFSIKNGGLETAVTKVQERFGELYEGTINNLFSSNEDLVQYDSSTRSSEYNSFVSSLSPKEQDRIRSSTTEQKKELEVLIQEKAKFGDPRKSSTRQEIFAGQVTKSDTLLSDSRELTNDSVYLYLPGGLEFNDTLKYEEVNFSFMKALTSDIGALGSLASLRVLQKLGTGLDKVAGLMGQEDINATRFIEKQLGVVVNPRKEQHFQGVETRTLDLLFNFAPRSKEEAKMVADIIKVFRFHAYPEVSQNKAFFNFPSEFEINAKTYNHRTGQTTRNPAIPKMNRCVLKGIKTNYTPDDIYRSFADGWPVLVSMTLSFVEADYITRQHIVDGY